MVKKPDRRWFVKALKQSRYKSFRELAPLIETRSGVPIQQARLSEILNGKRGVDILEAAQLAELLGQDFIEVVRRLGVSVRVSRSQSGLKTPRQNEP